MAGGVLPLLGGVVLALAFALLVGRRFGALVLAARVQSVAVAAAAAWQAFATGSAVLWGLALVVLLGGGAALPWGLRRAGGDGPVAAPRAARVTAAAALLVGLAMLAVLPVHLPGLPPLRENLALAVAAALLALLMLPTRRAALPQLVGLLALANGVALLAVVAGVAPAVPLATGVALLFGFVAAGLAALPGAAP